jgi:hypothetical protein
MKWNASGAIAILLFGELTAVGCSHLWESLEPLPGAGTSTTSTGGGGEASSTVSGTGGATSTVSSSASSGGAGGSGGGSSGSSGSTGGSDGGSTAGTIEYKATFAGCNSDKNLDVMACEQLVGDGGIMNVDGQTGAMTITRGFMRFDLDGALSGKTIDSVQLRLVTAGVSNAGSDKSGQIWQVAPFTKDSLGLGQPADVGMAAVAPDLGAVVPLQDYLWKLPATLVAPSKPVFLSIRTSSTDGADYWNDHGKDPPRLIVDYH